MKGLPYRSAGLGVVMLPGGWLSALMVTRYASGTRARSTTSTGSAGVLFGLELHVQLPGKRNYQCRRYERKQFKWNIGDEGAVVPDQRLQVWIQVADVQKTDTAPMTTGTYQ